ncbi:hypothetical protein PR048_016188 [Dryococelus australis]|uniref:Uncharacterized protein n=1 Tax=Dryococelus australis TaxID=614101 RepID=A0ABQ9HJM2_9NEOP|nr:hypothetical protein PR048_016188 [Dryococelus australis]
MDRYGLRRPAYVRQFRLYAQGAPLTCGLSTAVSPERVFKWRPYNFISRDSAVKPSASFYRSFSGEPGSISGWVTGFSQVGIVLDDVVGRRVFSGISRFPSLRSRAALYSPQQSSSSALTTSLLRAAQIPSHSIKGTFNGFVKKRIFQTRCRCFFYTTLRRSEFQLLSRQYTVCGPWYSFNGYSTSLTSSVTDIHVLCFLRNAAKSQSLLLLRVAHATLCTYGNVYFKEIAGISIPCSEGRCVVFGTDLNNEVLRADEAASSGPDGNQTWFPMVKDKRLSRYTNRGPRFKKESALTMFHRTIPHENSHSLLNVHNDAAYAKTGKPKRFGSIAALNTTVLKFQLPDGQFRSQDTLMDKITMRRGDGALDARVSDTLIAPELEPALVLTTSCTLTATGAMIMKCVSPFLPAVTAHCLQLCSWRKLRFFGSSYRNIFKALIPTLTTPLLECGGLVGERLIYTGNMEAFWPQKTNFSILPKIKSHLKEKRFQGVWFQQWELRWVKCVDLRIFHSFLKSLQAALSIEVSTVNEGGVSKADHLKDKNLVWLCLGTWPFVLREYIYVDALRRLDVFFLRSRHRFTRSYGVLWQVKRDEVKSDEPCGRMASSPRPRSLHQSPQAAARSTACGVGTSVSAASDTQVRPVVEGRVVVTWLATPSTAASCRPPRAPYFTWAPRGADRGVPPCSSVSPLSSFPLSRRLLTYSSLATRTPVSNDSPVRLRIETAELTSLTIVRRNCCRHRGGWQLQEVPCLVKPGLQEVIQLQRHDSLKALQTRQSNESEGLTNAKVKDKLQQLQCRLTDRVALQHDNAGVNPYREHIGDIPGVNMNLHLTCGNASELLHASGPRWLSGGELFCLERDSSLTGILSPPPAEQTRDPDSHESACVTRRRRARTQRATGT